MATEPDIQNARGFRSPLPDEDQKEERAAALAELKDVNVFSPTEMLTPGTAKRDDPIRTAINNVYQQLSPKIFNYITVAVAVKPHICWKCLRDHDTTCNNS